MVSVVICEKSTQRDKIMKAVGSRYGQIFAASGHLLELVDPEDVNPEWKKWGFHLLRPESGLYPSRPTRETRGNPKAKLDAIKNALKTATEVTIATDPDREGQLIGEELLRFFHFKGKVWRVLFAADDQKSIREAFDKRQPNENLKGLGLAAVARQQSDQMMNLSLTRAATVALLPPGRKGVIGIGRVKTPTLSIVCKRELEIRNFKPQTWFDITATCSVQRGQFQMRLRQAPETRILDQNLAKAVAARAEQMRGPLAVEKKANRQGPPKLFDLPALQKAASPRFGFSAARTLELAQELYNGQGKELTTYPRSEVRYLSENDLDNVPAICAAMMTIPEYANNQTVAQSLRAPQPRKGKSGHFSTAALAGEAHTAIIPNVNVMDELPERIARLSDDERKLFSLITDSYVRAMMPDYCYDSVLVSLAGGEFQGVNMHFSASSRTPTSLGWRSLGMADPNMAAENDDADEKKEGSDDTVAALPPLDNGEAGALSDGKIAQKVTQPPKRYNEGTLIDAMQNSWRFVERPDWREKLKEAKGIGTPATRGDIIEGLKRQGFIDCDKKGIFKATDSGLDLYGLLTSSIPNITDPGMTGAWELMLDEVAKNARDFRAVIDGICSQTAKSLIILEGIAGKSMVASAGKAAPARKTGGPGQPTDKMAGAAKAIAAKHKIKLDPAVLTDFASCKAFLDQHGTAKQPGGKPSGNSAPAFR